eukprot:7333914-Prymnesium_polylepis.1
MRSGLLPPVDLRRVPVEGRREQVRARAVGKLGKVLELVLRERLGREEEDCTHTCGCADVRACGRARDVAGRGGYAGGAREVEVRGRCAGGARARGGGSQVAPRAASTRHARVRRVCRACEGEGYAAGRVRGRGACHAARAEALEEARV